MVWSQMEWQVQQLKSFDFEKFEKRLSKRVETELRNHKRLFTHTNEVVGNMKSIVSREGGKMDILVTAAYLHELATPRMRYGEEASIFEGRTLLEEKKMISGRIAREVLTELDFPQEKVEIVAKYLELGDSLELKRAHHNAR